MESEQETEQESKRNYNIAMGIISVFFGIMLILLSYFMLGKPMCNGETLSFWWVLPFGIFGVLHIMLGFIWFSKKMK